MFAGSEADMLCHREDAIAKAKELKEVLLLRARPHIKPYDETDESLPKLVSFWGKALPL